MQMTAGTLTRFLDHTHYGRIAKPTLSMEYVWTILDTDGMYKLYQALLTFCLETISNLNSLSICAKCHPFERRCFLI